MATPVLRAQQLSWKFEGIQALLWRLVRLAFGLLVLVVVPLNAAVTHWQLDGMRFLATCLLITLAYGLPALVLAALVLAVSWSRGPAEVSVQRRRLVVQREGKPAQSWPLASLRSAWLHRMVPMELGVAGTQLEIETQRGDMLSLQFQSIEDARTLLDASGLDARHRSLRLTLGPTDFPLALLYLLGPSLAATAAIMIANQLAAHASWLDRAEILLVVTLLLFSAIFWLLRAAVRDLLLPARLTIGADGVKIEQNFRTEFLPFSAIKTWRVASDEVQFFLHDGTARRARGRHLGFDESASAVTERLHEARLVHLGRHGDEQARELLRRGGRSVAQWRQQLHEVLVRADYRHGDALDEATLLDTLRSPEEPADVRLGAALALREAKPERAHRLRVAARACANPRLRVALEQLAEGEIDEAALLAATEEESRPAHPEKRAEG